MGILLFNAPIVFQSLCVLLLWFQLSEMFFPELLFMLMYHFICIVV